MEASAASATPARQPPWRAGRPRRSAGERRAQRSRAHGRVAQALLRCFADLATHRGCQPSRLGIALGALLAAEGQGATVEAALSQDPEATAMPAPGVSCAATGATALPAPAASQDPEATAMPAPGVPCAAAGATALPAPAATVEVAATEHAPAALRTAGRNDGDVGTVTMEVAEFDQAPRHGSAVAVTLMGAETGGNSGQWAWNSLAEVFIPASAAAFAPCQGEDKVEQEEADVPMPGADVLSSGWWVNALASHALAKSSPPLGAPQGCARVVRRQVGTPAAGAAWLGFLDRRAFAFAACTWSLARDAVDMLIRRSFEEAFEDYFAAPTPGAACLGASSSVVVAPTPRAAGLRRMKGRTGDAVSDTGYVMSWAGAAASASGYMPKMR
jgi:hypothetical protein